MAKLTMREAVKRFDVSKPTLLKHLAIGKVSGIKDDSGQWAIDASELARVYVARQTELPEKRQLPEANPATYIPAKSADRIAELEKALAVAETKIAHLQQLADERGDRINDLRRLLPPADPMPRAPTLIGIFSRDWWRRQTSGS